MPFVRKRGKRWEGRALVDGGQIAAGSYATRTEAWAAAIEIERKHKTGHGAAARGKLVRDILDRYSEEVSPRKRGVRWEQTRLRALAREDWAQKAADRLSPDDLGKYRDRRLEKVSGSTIVREFNLLSDVFSVARNEWRWIPANPLENVRRPAEAPPRKRRLQEGELERLRVASGYRPDAPPLTVSARVVAAAEFAIETAMRAGEIVAMQWPDVHARHVHIPKTKNGEERDVPLSARALEILAQMRDLGENDPVFLLNERQRDALFRKLCDRALIEGLHFHDLRREATSRLAKKYDVMMLAKITGHKDLKLLLATYYAPSIEELAAPLTAG